MNTLSLAFQLWNHVVDEFCQFGRNCINSNFIHKAFYITQLQADRLQFCIKYIYLYLNMITTLQRRKWNSEKLQDHKLVYRKDELRPMGLRTWAMLWALCTVPDTGNEHRAWICSTVQHHHHPFPGCADFAGCSQNCGYLPASLLPLLHCAASKGFGQDWLHTHLNL